MNRLGVLTWYLAALVAGAATAALLGVEATAPAACFGFVTIGLLFKGAEVAGKELVIDLNVAGDPYQPRLVKIPTTAAITPELEAV